MGTPQRPPHPRRRARRWLATAVVLIALALLFWLREALYHRWVVFPAEAAAWRSLRAQTEPVTTLTGWREYRGILHTHSRLSHDCEVPFEEILRALKTNGLDFIGLSDHCANGCADFGRQWRGLHDGILFLPGFEMKEGIMPFGVAPDVVLSNQTDAATLARQVVEHGGVLFYAHSEEPRAWDRAELTGMEIYNIHSDFKRQPKVRRKLLPDILLNLRRYPDQVVRLIFARPTDFLRRWDDLNRTRHITGIAANDCHQNTGVRVVYTSAHTLRLEDTSPKTLAEFKLNWLTRSLLRCGFGPLSPNQRLLHVQLDPYARMSRFVNTHVLAHELSQAAILDALRAGRVFIGFDLIADSATFRWLAENQNGRAMMGETLGFSPFTTLRALSPLPCRFTVLRDGQTAHQRQGRTLEWTAPAPGKYRVEAELEVRGQWVPWVYANPIELR